MEPYEEEIIHETARVKDLKRRRWLKIIGIIFLASLFGGSAAAVASYVAVKAAAEDGTELAQRIQQECNNPGLTDPDLAQFCPQADQVVEAAPEQVKTYPVPGPPGEDGIDGIDGTDGTDGTDGRTGSNGKTGRSGQDSNVAGPSGPSGLDGIDGATGQPGMAGPKGDTGDSGVINIVDNCDPAPEGQLVDDVNANYRPDDQTIVLTCTYKDDGSISP